MWHLNLNFYDSKAILVVLPTLPLDLRNTHFKEIGSVGIFWLGRAFQFLWKSHPTRRPLCHVRFTLSIVKKTWRTHSLGLISFCNIWPQLAMFNSVQEYWNNARVPVGAGVQNHCPAQPWGDKKKRHCLLSIRFIYQGQAFLWGKRKTGSLWSISAGWAIYSGTHVNHIEKHIHQTSAMGRKRSDNW